MLCFYYTHTFTYLSYTFISVLSFVLEGILLLFGTELFIFLNSLSDRFIVSVMTVRHNLINLFDVPSYVNDVEGVIDQCTYCALISVTISFDLCNDISVLVFLEWLYVKKLSISNVEFTHSIHFFY